MADLAAAIGAGGYGEITSIVASRGGDVILETYLDDEPDQLRNTRSCTKTVASLLLGIAIDDGRVDGVDAPVLAHARRRPRAHQAAVKEGITFRDLLTMSSCLDCDDWDEASPGNEERMYPERDWAQFALDLPARAARGFSYCTAGVVLLGVALENAVGGDLAAFARDRLFAPLRIDRAEWVRTPLGETATPGGLRLTSRALLALGRLVLTRGGGVVPAHWLAESTRPHATIDDATQYGYLWWLKPYDGFASIYMTGMGGNRVHVFPELDAVVVVTTTNFGRRDAHALTDRLLVDELLPRLNGG